MAKFQLKEIVYPSISASASYNKEQNIYEIIVANNFVNSNGQNIQHFFRFTALLVKHQIALKIVEFSYWNDDYKEELASYKNLAHYKFGYQTPRNYYIQNGYKPNYISSSKAFKFVTENIYKLACDAFLQAIKNNFKLVKR
jgi:hypothetical protein